MALTNVRSSCELAKLQLRAEKSVSQALFETLQRTKMNFEKLLG